MSWGRASACPDWAVTSNCARGKLEPLLCRHQAVRRMSSVHWQPACKIYHDLVGLALGVLGDTSVGSHHQSVLTDILDSVDEDELSQLLPTAELCTVGPATGLAFLCFTLSCRCCPFPSSVATLGRWLIVFEGRLKPFVWAQKFFCPAHGWDQSSST